ncbi:hypothetical protein VTI28DRAFT_8315 [Corynascus sepedonium]
MAKTVVILGASYTGIVIAHYLLKYTAAKIKDLKVVLVSPNTHLYWNFASVRAIIPNQLGDDKLFLPLAPAFAKYSSNQYELVHGVAEKVDPDANVAEVRENGGSARTIHYDELVVATGANFKNDLPFKNLSTTEETKTALHSWAQRIEAAKSIVVAGAGATGVEVAGELGQEYAVTGKKQVTLVCDQDLPLSPSVRRAVRETVKKELERLKVKVITNARVASTTTPVSSLSKPGSPTATTKLSALTLTPTKAAASPAPPATLEADLLIPTYGITPNTAFLPASMLDERGYARQTTRLRAPGHENVFVVGDVGNLEEPQAVHADAQAVHAAGLLEARLLLPPLGGSVKEGTQSSSTAAKRGGEEGVKEDEYKPIDKIMFAVTLGRNRGTGQFGSWKLWSLLVWFTKGRYLGTNHAAEVVRGERTLSRTSW